MAEAVLQAAERPGLDLVDALAAAPESPRQFRGGLALEQRGHHLPVTVRQLLDRGAQLVREVPAQDHLFQIAALVRQQIHQALLFRLPDGSIQAEDLDLAADRDAIQLADVDQPVIDRDDRIRRERAAGRVPHLGGPAERDERLADQVLRVQPQHRRNAVPGEEAPDTVGRQPQVIRDELFLARHG